MGLISIYTLEAGKVPVLAGISVFCRYLDKV